MSDVFEYSSTMFRVTTNNDTIQRVREEVTSAFPELPTFSATQVLIATWIPLNETVNYPNILCHTYHYYVSLLFPYTQ